MAGEDLFEQGGARTRQAEDEDRIARRIARALPALEQVTCASRFLGREFLAHPVRVVAGLASFQRIASLVETERRLVFLAILMRLAEREAEMDAVHEGDFGSFELRVHRGDLRFGEAVGLEIGERVIGIAVIWLGGDGGAIGRDGIVLLSGGLESMAARGQRRRIARQPLKDGIEQGEGALVIPGLHTFDREMRLEQGAGGIAIIQRLRLLARAFEFLPLP